jgi:hypothetical protein
VVDLTGLAGIDLSAGAKDGKIAAADAQNVASRADAQYVIFGKAEGRAVESVMGTRMNSYQMTVTLRMFAVDNHQVVATATESRPVLSVSPDFGNKQAMTQYRERVVKLVADQLIERIAKRWTAEEQTGSKRVQLVAKGVPNFKVASALTKAVKGYKGVAKATRRSVKDQTAMIDVEMDTNADALAEQLEGAKVAGYKVEVEEVDEGRIVVVVKR